MSCHFTLHFHFCKSSDLKASLNVPCLYLWEFEVTDSADSRSLANQAHLLVNEHGCPPHTYVLRHIMRSSLLH